MTKKFYNQPEVSVAQINTLSIICASGAAISGANKHFFFFFGRKTALLFFSLLHAIRRLIRGPHICFPHNSFLLIVNIF